LTATTAPRWTCDSCGVSVSHAELAAVPLPSGWTTGPDGDFCLGCRRQRAAEAAVDGAPANTNRDTRVRLRREALVEFEVRRAPDRPDNSIAQACRTSASAVVTARQKLQLPR
jgi:hypothetical protein